MASTSSSNDSGLAIGVTLAGIAVLLVAVYARYDVNDLSPGIHGCLTATMAGFVAALLHRLPYRFALALSTPTTLAQWVVCSQAGGRALGLGMTAFTLLFFGAAGVLLRVSERDHTRRIARVADSSIGSAASA
jgi:hypothetical protein